MEQALSLDSGAAAGEDGRQKPCGFLRRSLASMNGRLYLALFAKSSLPTLYMTSRIFFLGQLPSATGLDIASQLYWVNLFLEVMQEALLTPLYPCIGETTKERATTMNKVRSGLLVTLLLYSTCSIVIAALAEVLVAAMATPLEHQAATAQYIRWEMLGCVLQGLERFLHVVFVLLGGSRQIYTMAILQTVATIACDYMLVSQLPGSFRLGVIGIAVSNICSYLIVLIYAAAALIDLVAFSRNELRSSLSWSWLHAWWRVGRSAALVSFVRNFTYIYFIARMLNLLREPGAYYVANNFVWSWLLLPFNPLAELLKQEVARMPRVPHAHRQVAAIYFLFAALLFVFWLATSFAWPVFFRAILNVQKPTAALAMTSWLVPFYLPYMVATLLDSIFYGYGLTGPLAVATIVANFGVYGTAFALFKWSKFVPTTQSVAFLFGAGMSVSCVVRSALYYVYFVSNSCITGRT